MRMAIRVPSGTISVLLFGNGLTMMANIAPVWAWFLAGMVFLLIFIATYAPEIRRWWQRSAAASGPLRRRDDRPSSSPGEPAGSVVSMVVVGCAAIGLFYHVIFVSERSPMPIWVHPTMAPAEQMRVEARCRTQAMDAIGPGDLLGRPHDRLEYIANCLIAQGFKLQQIDG